MEEEQPKSDCNENDSVFNKTNFFYFCIFATTFQTCILLLVKADMFP
ncbi:hypothetical protein BSG1_19315 [Bacillus sp. SG-1]|nr:hypothetical protein BSG1_19315 [Bacillus sp. SG-1]